MKKIADCTDQELGYIAYMNLKQIEVLRNENAAIDQTLARRQEQAQQTGNNKEPKQLQEEPKKSQEQRSLQTS